jgi:hypothetical protein
MPNTNRGAELVRFMLMMTLMTYKSGPPTTTLSFTHNVGKRHLLSNRERLLGPRNSMTHRCRQRISIYYALAGRLFMMAVPVHA